MKKFARFGVVLMLLVSAFVGWYSIAANYDYGALSGTYTINRNGEQCTLHLRPDQTFTEELKREGVAQQKAEGRWRRYGQAHVSFSGEFLKVSGQELNASGEAHGQFDKALGLFLSLTLAPLPDGPTFRKKLFH
ncbi:hypothetical protein [Granulicella sp. dw_53]|uniref:hypothetical protein n=1 Tax=Granulicella sp. dw_53 TaxID=2719792 RepID=UPI001BD5486A|nr:hypothetical protein [Granulicella sp. dw_53]